jgi:hypothetical protein
MRGYSNSSGIFSKQKAVMLFHNVQKDRLNKKLCICNLCYTTTFQ